MSLSCPSKTFTLLSFNFSSFALLISDYSLGIAYNAFPGQTLQNEFESWAKAAYPLIWKQLEKRGWKKVKLEIQDMILDTRRKFKIFRRLKADDSHLTGGKDESVEGEDRIDV